MTAFERVADGARPARSSRLPMVLRLAVRELRSGLGGFRVLIACMALGVGVIAAVGALAAALRAGFESQGQVLLGGDVTLSRMHQRATPAELGWMEGRGTVSETATMRAMARTPDGSDQTLIELKGVDGAYPLTGEVAMGGNKRFADTPRAAGSAVVEPLLLARLRLKVGDKIKIGESELSIAGAMEKEPDTISDRVTYGPRVLVSLATLERTGLVQPGSLIRWRYALRLADAAPASLKAFRKAATRELPESGFISADRRDPSPTVTRTLERLRQFLTLLGLTSLLIGGVGIANAVATFVDRRRKVIATMKSLGATGQLVLGVFLVQVMAMALLGIAIGVGVGLTVPVLLDYFYGDALPIRAVITFDPWSIASAISYGILVALVFTLWPLGRAERITPAVLFREEVAPERTWPSRGVIALTAAALAALVAFAIVASESRMTAVYYCAAVAVTFALFYGFGYLVVWLARRLPRPRSSAELRLALGNIGAPDGLTRSVVLSLGAGLSLLVAVALADASMMSELTTRVPQTSPAYFVLDIARSERDAFDAVVLKATPDARIDEAPMLRGRIVQLNGVPADKLKVSDAAQWVLNGDRGLTYAEDVPDGSKVVAGDWWPADYAGEPLVSFEADLAKRLGLKLGDTVTVNVLGRNITARIANLREVKWENLGINFVMIFSPNTLKAAPYNLLATITIPAGTSVAEEADLGRAVSGALPHVTMIRVKDALDAFRSVFTKVMTAIRIASGVTLAAGALVLAGALATAQRRRIKQAVILKTLGATRGRILASHLIEYVVLATATALLATVLGAIAAWIAVHQVMEIEFVLSPGAVAFSLALALGLVVLFGLVGTWSVLRAPAVPHLRAS